MIYLIFDTCVYYINQVAMMKLIRQTEPLCDIVYLFHLFKVFFY